MTSLQDEDGLLRPDEAVDILQMQPHVQKERLADHLATVMNDIIRQTSGHAIGPEKISGKQLRIEQIEEKGGKPAVRIIFDPELFIAPGLLQSGQGGMHIMTMGPQVGRSLRKNTRAEEDQVVIKDSTIVDLLTQLQAGRDPTS